MSFSGKVVLVTGGSSGIGAATGVLFAAEGARVALVARDENRLQRVAERCQAVGAPPLIIKADVANDQEASTIVKQTVDHFGQLDVLVNNAGIANYVALTDPHVLNTFDQVMNTNLRSIVLLTSLAAPHLAETKGNIVNVSSVISTKPFPGFAYCVSKAGLDHFTRCAALELAATGVRVNCVNPGPVRTAINEKSGLVPVGAGDATWDKMKNWTAMNRVGEPEEIADVIAFLASDKAKSITGSNYVSDNGVLLK